MQNVEDEAGALTMHEIMDRNENTLRINHVANWAVGRMLKRLFRNLKVSTKRSPDTTETLYRGIRWIVDEHVETVPFQDIKKHVEGNALCIMQTDHCIILTVPTDITSDGMILMKELT